MNSICGITLARVLITTHIKEQSAQKMYSMIALLTSLEATLGVINACLPIMKPVFTKFLKSKVFSHVTPSFLLGSRRGTLRSHPSAWRKTSFWSFSKYKSLSGSDSGSGGSHRMESWTRGTSDAAYKPRFVDAKAAQVMFGHTSAPSSRNPHRPPRPPPKSMYYTAEPVIRVSLDGDEEKMSGILV